MPSQHTHAPDARRLGLNNRLRRLKAAVLAATAIVTLGTWALVTGAVAAVTAPAPAATTTTPTVSVNRGDDGFFGGGSSLGSGTGQRPVARSRGS